MKQREPRKVRSTAVEVLEQGKRNGSAAAALGNSVAVVRFRLRCCADNGRGRLSAAGRLLTSLALFWPVVVHILHRSPRSIEVLEGVGIAGVYNARRPSFVGGSETLSRMGILALTGL